ncbi:MAG: hypothetical protein IJ274_12060 [Lachnospiraceae bacterium]|nr:hypothetical protein [Lachnospiraceae bacterium]
MIFKCKNCGGNSVYHPDKKAMWCPHCESLDSQERVDTENMEICTNCGATLDSVTEYTSALKCSHCGSYIILKDRVEGENRPELILPFAISKEKAVEILKKEFGSRLLTPDSFLSHATLECLEGSYIPFWLYDYMSRVDYEGKATKVRTFRSGQYEVTETSHYRVTRKLDIQFDKIPVDASKRMANDIMDLMEPYEYQALLNFEEKYMSGFQGEIVNFSDAEEEERAKQKARNDSESLLNETILGYTTSVPLHKDIRIERQKARFALMPVWVYRYNFRGKDYVYHVNGQTGKVIGKTPTDKRKAWWYSAAVAFMAGMTWQSICWILGVF